VVVLTTPLQAAGEEFGFRGLVQRSAGSWFRNPTTAFVVSTLISGAAFGAAHFAADPWLIAYYFLFGVSASIAARLTGGLEAPILVHVVNNVLIFVPAALLGQLDAGIDRSEGAGGPFILLPIAMVLTAAALSGWWARRNGITVRAPSIPVLDKRMPSFTGIDHLALTVTDLDVSVPFYEKLWGMPVAGSLEGNDLTRRIFRLPSGTTVGLTQHDTSASTAFSPFTPGMDHVGFGVESVEELGRWVAHLDELGIDNSGLVEADYGVAVSFTDPDGTALEFFVGR
jgi:catechol 2,3-dioxygenase-like lactoylglutathione lyase family enzyme